MPGRPVPAPVAAMDRLTWEGMTTGTVTLPRRTVHVGVWLRMLRTLLDEVSLSGSRVRQRSATALEQIWDAAGSPPRAGLKVWRPYEALGAPRQEAMLEAAACALDLIQAGKITAYGTLGHLLTGQPSQHVYDGDRPARRRKHAPPSVTPCAAPGSRPGRTSRTGSMPPVPIPP